MRPRSPLSKLSPPALGSLWFGLALATTLAAGLSPAHGQDRRTRLQNLINQQDAKISEQRVQRQTEVMRLERQISDLRNRLIRMERQLLAMSRPPVISIAEAKAEIELAEMQLAESQKRREQGQGSELQVARDRLALVRARGWLDAAQAAQAENELISQLEVTYARRQLLEASNEKEQMQRMVAKGYVSSDGLRYQLLDVDLAEKQLELAQMRLQSQRQTDDEADSPSLSSNAADQRQPLQQRSAGNEPSSSGSDDAADVADPAVQ